MQVPRVYWQYSSPSVLTLQYMPGTKITDVTQITAAGGWRKLWHITVAGAIMHGQCIEWKEVFHLESYLLSFPSRGMSCCSVAGRQCRPWR